MSIDSKIDKQPLISVVSIAKTEEELFDLKYILNKQVFSDFEFVYSTKGSIPEAWNDAIKKAKGKFIVFTESDAKPYNDQWLLEISKNLPRDNLVYKGLEIGPTDLNMCNLVISRQTIKSYSFNEKYDICEDTEFFAKLRANGVEIIFIESFPVIHIQKYSWKKTINRAFKSGMYFSKIIYMHGISNIDNVNTRNYKSSSIHPLSNRIRIIVDNILTILGLFFGAIIYLPILIKKNK